MKPQRLLLLVCALSSTGWAGEKEWQEAHAWAGAADWRDVFFAAEFADEVDWGEWKIRATISLPEEHGGRKAWFVLQGSSTGIAQFSFRASLTDPRDQIALLHAVHPDWTITDIGGHLLSADVELAQEARQNEVVKEFERLLEAQAPILPDHPEVVYLHPTSYCLEALAGPGPVSQRYCVVDFGGQPEEIEASVSRGIEYHPLAVGLCRLHNALVQRWRDQQEREGFAQLRDRLDLSALGVSLLHYALAHEWDALATRLMDWGLNVRVPDPAGSWALVQACWAGRLGLVQRILDAGAPVAVRQSSGSPLSAAAESGNPQVVRLLLDRGAGHAEQDWQNVFMSAAAGGSIEILEQLTAVEKAPGDREMLLVIAGGRGHLAMARYLVEHGTPVSALALDAACASGVLELVDWMTRPERLGGVKNRQEALNSALATAVGESPEMVRLLIARGADVDGRRSNWHCQTALAAARDAKRNDIADVLIAAGAIEPPGGARCGE